MAPYAKKIRKTVAPGERGALHRANLRHPARRRHPAIQAERGRAEPSRPAGLYTQPYWETPSQMRAELAG